MPIIKGPRQTKKPPVDLFHARASADREITAVMGSRLQENGSIVTSST